MTRVLVDTTFDFRSDTPVGGDPDALSPTLRKYHQLLWGKPLPSGKMFGLSTLNGRYLYHNSDLGEFVLSSDSVAPSFTRWVRMQPIIKQIPPEESEAFRTKGYTIGGMMIWIANHRGSQKSLNVARGFNQKIADRMDLTLECIRRYYLGEDSPLSATIFAYNDYFELFQNFQGFVDHFLLQDMVTEDYSAIKFFMNFDDFVTTGVPKDLANYYEYRKRTIEWIDARNRRIDKYCSQLNSSDLLAT